MASIRKKVTSRGETRYEARLMIDGRQVSKSFRRKRDADEWANKTEVDKTRGLAVDPAAGRVTVAEYVDKDISARTLAATTEVLYGDLLTRLISPGIGNVRLGELSPDAVRRWFKATQADFGRVQTAKAYRLLRAACNVAVEEGVLGRNPCRIKGGGQEGSPERKVLDVSQVLGLAEAIDQRLRAFVLLAAFGGLRREELLGLRRFDVDLAAGTVRIDRAAVFVKGKRIVKEPKTNAGRRTVTLPPSVVESLDHHLDYYAEAGGAGWVFVGAKGEPLSLSTLYKEFDTARKAAGTEVTIHELRHSAGTLAAQLGATMREIMARLGQSSSQAAMLYQHAAEGRDRELAKRIEGAMEVARQPLALVDPVPGDQAA